MRSLSAGSSQPLAPHTPPAFFTLGFSLCGISFATFFTCGGLAAGGAGGLTAPCRASGADCEASAAEGTLAVV